VVYQYISPSDQDELPYFDPIDRIEDVSLVTYSLTNTFSFKSKKTGENRQGPRSPATSAFKPFCRFMLEQSYLFNTETETAEKPFTPIYGEIELALGRWFSIDADARWSTENNHFLSRNIALRATDSRGDRLFIEYGFGRNLNETLNAEVIIKLTDRLSAFVEMERNLREERFIERGIGFVYMSQCWSIDVGYKDEQDDEEFFFMVNLHGLGDLGKAYASRRIHNPFDF
jgi:LPS-assembly protein